MFRELIVATVVVGIGVHTGGQHADDTKASFSLPRSTLLFSTYDELVISTSDHIEAVRPPMEISANHGFFSYPSISQSGDLIAWGFATQTHKEATKYLTQYALGVFSRTNKKWTIYAGLDRIGRIEALSFSPDRLHVAFVNEKDDKRELLILDLNSGAIRTIPHPGLWYRTSLSWSPDSKCIVMIINQASKDNPFVAILHLETSDLQTLTEGIGATWSPNGEWIALYDPSGEKCLIVHPDGTAMKTVAKLRETTFSSNHFGWGNPVWSPDSKRLLMTEIKGDLRSFDVDVLDLESGRIRTMKRDSLPIFGWVPE
jgi:hypothetical protein